MRFKEFIADGLNISAPEYDGMYNHVDFTNDNNEVIGKMGYRVKSYKAIEDGNFIAELHIGVDPNHRRKGYAQEMIKALVTELGVPGYMPFARIDNPIVHNVIKKVGQHPNFNVEILNSESEMPAYLIKRL